MTKRTPLGEFEHLVLLAVMRLGTAAYAVPIREEIEERTSRRVTRGALYVTLDRLEQKGYLGSRLADPTPERGGRAKRFYELTPAGALALEQSWAALNSMRDGLQPSRGKA
jgi:PadR family transcriptional regulator PadR